MFAAAMAACLVVGCVQDVPVGGPPDGSPGVSRPVAADARPAPGLGVAGPLVEQSRRTALMFQPQPMRAVAAALRARQHPMQPGRATGERAAASPGRASGR